MKGVKEEEKTSSPMFPRLHVNDTDKGGPRPPPRNKMALYEQLCIPSQRFNSSSSLLPSQNAQNVGSSLKKGNGHEGNVLSPFYSSATVAVTVEKVNSRSSDGEDARSREREFERSAVRNMNFKSANAVGSVAECSSLHRDASNTKNSSWKRVDDDDDFRVPTYVNYENVLNLYKDTSGAEKRMLTTLNSSVQLSSSCKRILEQTSHSDPKSGKLERSSRQKLNDMSVLGEQTAQALAHQEAGEKLAESSRFVKSSSDREPTASCLKSCGNDPLNGLTAQSDPHSKASVSHRSMNVADVCNQTTDDKENSSLEQSDAERNDEMSDTSMVDSISGLEISPDDVVGVIGPKQFWKARRTIVKYCLLWRMFMLATA
ncbi:protein EARLY FLOWERING 3-like isoform X2 [Asparagus officinalis]|uniref:protein EARLY FLOWERING 3-like isoform X2 n=1 Tax=Asparagus officinalis TaxID=4686 RepID=UPI00098E8635|nr:protein EARLY FLOWERING 3-like isoform X2 [Asparagus officinalis]